MPTTQCKHVVWMNKINLSTFNKISFSVDKDVFQYQRVFGQTFYVKPFQI